MDVRRIDPHHDDRLARYQDVAYRAEMNERPWENMWSLDELRSRFNGKNSSERTELYCAFEGGRVVGGAFAELPLLDNTDKVYAHVSVDPEHRRRASTAIVDFVVERCEQELRSTVIGESSYPFDQRETHAHRMFAERNGFSVANTEIVRELRLPVPKETLETMASECAPRHREYRIETCVDQIPEESRRTATCRTSWRSTLRRETSSSRRRR